MSTGPSPAGAEFHDNVSWPGVTRPSRATARPAPYLDARITSTAVRFSSPGNGGASRNPPALTRFATLSQGRGLISLALGRGRDPLPQAMGG